MSHNIDFATSTIYKRNLVGTYIDANGNEHKHYHIYYEWQDTIPASGYVTHTIGLSDCNILRADFCVYRSDVGVINTDNTNPFQIVLTGNGDVIRLTNGLTTPMTGTVRGTIDCYLKQPE